MLTQIKLIIRDNSTLCSKLAKEFMKLSSEYSGVKFITESINNNYSAVIDIQRNGCYNLPCVIKTNDIGIEYYQTIKTLKELKKFLKEEK